MGRSVSLSTIGGAAARALRVAALEVRPRRRRGLLRSFRSRVSVALVFFLVLMLSSPLVRPARAVLDSFAAAQVVAQMGALVGQMAAIKGTVEEQRQQARAAFYGKLAPLASKMRTVNCFLANANGLSLGFTQCLGGTPAPLRYEDPAGQTVLDHIPFNRPIDVCAAQTGIECYDEPVTAPEITRVGTVVTGLAQAAVARDSLNVRPYPAHTVARHARQAAVFTTLAPGVVQQEEGFERNMARKRAVVEGAMAVVEEWRGCQAVAAGGTLDTSDPRLPCLTNTGLGRDATDGTVGMVQELAAQLQLIEDAQDGDPTENQLSTIQTQVGLMQARLSAAAVELRAVRAEADQLSQLRAEASLRRSQELFRLRMDCVDGRSTAPASPFNIFIPAPGGAAAGECLAAP